MTRRWLTIQGTTTCLRTCDSITYRLLPVPRLLDGPDLSALERLAAEHRPKVYFTQSALQNPTGTNMSSHAAFKVLQLAERYGFYVVEDDIFCDLQATQTPRLAALDQLDRVIYARSFSKTLSGSVRVGFLACSQELADNFADIKMLTSITSSQVTERLVHQMLIVGHYHKYLNGLRQRLAESRARVLQTLEGAGAEVFIEPQAGMFLWARFPEVDDSMAVVDRAQQEGLLFAPGTVFRPHLEPSPWMRFNVAVCDDVRVARWIGRTAADLRKGAP